MSISQRYLKDGDHVHEAYIVQPDQEWAARHGVPPRELLAIYWTPRGASKAVGFVRILTHNPSARSTWDPDNPDDKRFIDLGHGTPKRLRSTLARMIKDFASRGGRPKVHRLKIDGGPEELRAKLLAIPGMEMLERPLEDEETDSNVALEPE